MNVIYDKPLDDKIIVFGMSCAGKTTFANLLKDHRYHNFDSLFWWHMVETFGFSIEANLQQVRSTCREDRFVLDGWHLSDKAGKFFPVDTVVYVIYAPYEEIVRQYRIPVTDPNEFYPMFKKWYWEIDYAQFPNTRYFLNDSDFIEITYDKFTSLSKRSP